MRKLIVITRSHCSCRQPRRRSMRHRPRSHFPGRGRGARRGGGRGVQRFGDPSREPAGGNRGGGAARSAGRRCRSCHNGGETACSANAAWHQWGTWPYEQRITDTTYWCAVYGGQITYRSSSVSATGTLCGSNWTTSQLISGGMATRGSSCGRQRAFRARLSSRGSRSTRATTRTSRGTPGVARRKSEPTRRGGVHEETPRALGDDRSGHRPGRAGSRLAVRRRSASASRGSRSHQTERSSSSISEAVAGRGFAWLPGRAAAAAASSGRSSSGTPSSRSRVMPPSAVSSRRRGRRRREATHGVRRPLLVPARARAAGRCR